MADTSTKPYMLRALHEWCTDNGYTPQIVVQVDSNTLVPPSHIRDGQITLNIGSLATNRLVIGNEAVEFQARFSGVTENIYVPISAVNAIFARETGAGMGFETGPDSMSAVSNTHLELKSGQSHKDADPAAPASVTDDAPKPPDNKRPKLTIVK